MLELMVIASDMMQHPTIVFSFFDYFPTVHHLYCTRLISLEKILLYQKAVTSPSISIQPRNGLSLLHPQRHHQSQRRTPTHIISKPLRMSGAFQP